MWDRPERTGRFLWSCEACLPPGPSLAQSLPPLALALPCPARCACLVCLCNGSSQSRTYTQIGLPVHCSWHHEQHGCPDSITVHRDVHILLWGTWLSRKSWQVFSSWFKDLQIKYPENSFRWNFKMLWWTVSSLWFFSVLILDDVINFAAESFMDLPWGTCLCSFLTNKRPIKVLSALLIFL